MKRILVLDDEKNIRFTVRRCLENAQYQIEDAINGEEALTILSKNSFDLLLLDLKLPGMDGMEVLKLVRDLYPDLKVIIISAHGTVQTAVQALRSGALEFLEKPFTPDEIRNAVQKALA